MYVSDSGQSSSNFSFVMGIDYDISHIIYYVGAKCSTQDSKTLGPL
jgi:hypothetical protein